MTETTADRQGLPVTIQTGGGQARGFVLDVEKMSWRTVPVARQAVDQGARDGEQSLSNVAVWRRGVDSWLEGAGQEHADLEGSSGLRFRSSTNINPWREGNIRVHQAVTDKLITVGAADARWLETLSVAGVDYLVFAVDDEIRYTTDPAANTPTWTLHTGMPATVLTGFTTDGRRWWATDSAIVYTGVPGTLGVSTFSTHNAQMIGYANGRLLASSNNNVLSELDGAGSATTLYTHPNPNFEWKGVAASPGGIYLWGDNGSRSEVYVIPDVTSAGALGALVLACDYPRGERVNTMMAYGGVMVIGSTRGLRVASIEGNGLLYLNSVIDDAGEIRALEPYGEDVYFGWTANSGLGRARLSRLTGLGNDLVPAFASDLSDPDGLGVDPIVAVTTFDGFPYWATEDGGVLGAAAGWRTTGTIDLGWFTFGISEDKLLDSVSVWTSPLEASCSVQIQVFADDATGALVTLTHDVDGAGRRTQVYAGETIAERFRVVATITQVANRPIPLEIRRIAIRAVPRPFIAEEITLPFNLSTTASDPSIDTEIGQNPLTEWQLLHSLMVERKRCTVTVGGHTFVGRIEAIEAVNGGLGGGNGLNGFDDDAEFFDGSWDVTFITLEPASA